MAYEQLTGPLGQPRDDVLAALISAAITNSMRGKGQPLPISKFLPRWGETREELGGDDQEPPDPAGGGR